MRTPRRRAPLRRGQPWPCSKWVTSRACTTNLEFIVGTVNRRLWYGSAGRAGEPLTAGQVKPLSGPRGYSLRGGDVRERSDDQEGDARAVGGVGVRSTGEDGSPARSDVRMRVERPDDDGIGDGRGICHGTVRLPAGCGAPGGQGA